MKLVIFIGGNQFFVLPRLIVDFEEQHPELKGHIFYETLPPGILRKQIAANDAITLGNLTIQVKPDVYEAGARVLKQMEQANQLKGFVQYATNDLEIMIPAANPKNIQSLKDLGRADVALSMPNPEWEGVANQIADSLRKAGGDSLYQAVYQDKVKNGMTILTEIHHRQTPMRIMSGRADAGGYLGIRGALSGEYRKSDQGRCDPCRPQHNRNLCGRCDVGCSAPGCRCAVACFSQERPGTEHLSPIRISLHSNSLEMNWCGSLSPRGSRDGPLSPMVRASLCYSVVLDCS